MSRQTPTQPLHKVRFALARPQGHGKPAVIALLLHPINMQEPEGAQHACNVRVRQESGRGFDRQNETAARPAGQQHTVPHRICP